MSIMLPRDGGGGCGFTHRRSDFRRRIERALRARNLTSIGEPYDVPADMCSCSTSSAAVLDFIAKSCSN
jgi:hypothetical protein